ncbi:hypothetical protein GCM10023322_52210 [Rugosimonospora acidiphila]|uniref:Uncharacterized protein n=1 Tax=Rugosimonospora acidiphila TaxID=556531 RepID=A0ABP9S9N9_9ACTN
MRRGTLSKDGLEERTTNLREERGFKEAASAESDRVGQRMIPPDVEVRLLDVALPIVPADVDVSMLGVFDHPS